MVEPTIWPALEEIRQKQAEECKTRRTYVEPTIWPAWEGEKAKQGEECKDKTDLW
ncbi:hypothetical protein DPMN_005248 [Dreissena polymorpha]|uniref:Uncharacterized protein n=1 Tax=Dreissena polymorpha TaxID=45954 RepID=A0A9D4RWE0_DREPO|nr:hypothetical protein DPMN_005248 [Dreissena polymorpha]